MAFFTINHLREYETYINLAHPGDENAKWNCFPKFLKGKSLDWYRTYVAALGDERVYETMRAEMLTYFRKSERQLRVQGIRKQSSDESVEAYTTFLRNITTLRQMTPEQSINKLIEGVRKTIGEVVSVQDPLTFDDAVTYAKVAEAGENAQKVTIASMQKLVEVSEKTASVMQAIAAKEKKGSKAQEETEEDVNAMGGPAHRGGYNNYNKGRNDRSRNSDRSSDRNPRQQSGDRSYSRGQNYDRPQQNSNQEGYRSANPNYKGKNFNPHYVPRGRGGHTSQGRGGYNNQRTYDNRQPQPLLATPYQQQAAAPAPQQQQQQPQQQQRPAESQVSMAQLVNWLKSQNVSLN